MKWFYRSLMVVIPIISSILIYIIVYTDASNWIKIVSVPFAAFGYYCTFVFMNGVAEHAVRRLIR